MDDITLATKKKRSYNRAWLIMSDTLSRSSIIQSARPKRRYSGATVIAVTCPWSSLSRPSALPMTFGERILISYANLSTPSCCIVVWLIELLYHSPLVGLQAILPSRTNRAILTNMTGRMRCYTVGWENNRLAECEGFNDYSELT